MQWNAKELENLDRGMFWHSSPGFRVLFHELVYFAYCSFFLETKMQVLDKKFLAFISGFLCSFPYFGTLLRISRSFWKSRCKVSFMQFFYPSFHALEFLSAPHSALACIHEVSRTTSIKKFKCTTGPLV